MHGVPGGEQMEEAAQLAALATAGAAALRTGEQWLSLLYRTERFGHLGFTNTMLIWAQCPDAVQVHDYAGWKQLGRQVIRGERGIRILGDRGQVTNVFDLLQTTGEPQPVLIKRPKNGAKPGPKSWRALAALASLDEVPVEVTDELAAAERLTRCVAAKLPAGRSGGGLAAQVEIESVAFLIATRLGFGASGFGFPYVTSWAGTDPRAPTAEIVAVAWERITSAAARASAVIDLHMPAPTRLLTGPRLVASQRTVPPVPPKILETAARYYARRLAGSWVPAYLGSRGFNREVLRQWGIGYAPGGWTALTDYLRGIGYDDAAIEAAGLAQRSKRGTLIDVFRDRAVFPVRSPDGTVVGFLGRAAPGAQAGTPKYLNTRETEFYHKGDLLFGLHEGRQVLADGGRAVIVEGPLDAIAVSVAGEGRYAGVAPCGTALTAAQVASLEKVGKVAPILAFDGDQAGRKAAIRAYSLLNGSDALVADFAEQLDPAELLRAHGPSALLKALEQDVHPLADVVVDGKVAAFGHWLGFIEGKFNALRAVAPLVAALPGDQVARQVGRVAQLLELTHAEVTVAVADAVREACQGEGQPVGAGRASALARDAARLPPSRGEVSPALAKSQRAGRQRPSAARRAG
jgi:DNA primase